MTRPCRCQSIGASRVATTLGSSPCHPAYLRDDPPVIAEQNEEEPTTKPRTDN
jgi:hypothetical protein